VDFVNPGGLADGVRDQRGVTGQHDNLLHAGPAQVGHHVGRVRTYLVGHRHHTKHGVIDSNDHRGAPGRGQLLCGPGRTDGVSDAKLLKQGQIADQDPAADGGGSNALARDGLGMLGQSREGQILDGSCDQDRTVQRVLGAGLGPRSPGEHRARSILGSSTTTSVSLGRPLVRAPVLSTATAVILAEVSGNSPPLIRIPSLAARLR
jgi:hypothetical protein